MKSMTLAEVQQKQEYFYLHKKFYSNIRVDLFNLEGCHTWVGIINNKNYGHLYFHGKRKMAHGLSFELFYGYIDSTKEIDHLCKNTLCVNPRHLELVTYKENIDRSNSITVLNSKKTRCKHGHEFTPENTYKPNYGTNSGKRICKTCVRLANKKSRRK